MNDPTFYDGCFETNKFNMFLQQKQTNEFIKVKVVIKLNNHIEKVIFIVFYVKDVNKSVNTFTPIRKARF